MQTALSNENIIVMTAENRALFRNMPKNLGDRFIDTGITEQTLIGAAAGLALRGRVPVVHALASFLTMRAFEFIRTDIGIPNLPIKLSGFIPGFLSDGNGATHQAIEDISLMRGIPNMTVFAPADEQDLLIMLPEIWASSKPAYTRINTRNTDYQHDTNFEIGKAEVVSKGTDITILVNGMLFEQALIAVDLMQNLGKSVGLVNMRCLKPVDEAVILEVAESSELVVVLEDHFFTGGLYSIVAETLLKHQKTANVLSISLFESWFKPALLNLKFKNIDGDQITFVRQKTAITNRTETKIQVNYHPKAKEIVSLLGNKEVKDSHIFPLFTNEMTTLVKKRVLHGMVKNINKYMRRIGKKLEIDKDITTYVARHSFVTGGASITEVKDIVGHTSIATTEKYVASIEDDRIKQLSNTLMTFST